jgi:hypothetical protein
MEQWVTTYGRVLVRKSVVDGHVFEIGLKEPLGEIFNHVVVETRINEYRSNVSLYHIRETLEKPSKVRSHIIIKNQDPESLLTLGGSVVVVHASGPAVGSDSATSISSA